VKLEFTSVFLFQIHAEFQLISPFVPVRQVNFLRLCKQLTEGVWAVVDVSIDANQENLNAQAPVTCKRLPSGCIIQDMNNGCSKVMTCIDSSFVVLVYNCGFFIHYGCAPKILSLL
jgi:hypothetical protein